MEGKVDTLVVEASLPRGRLDSYLRDRYPCVSRNTLQRLIREGEVRVDNEVVKPTHHPVEGEVITLHWPPPKPATVEPRDLPLRIVYEDEHLLVLDKSAGMVVHPAAGNEDNTLVSALLHHCRGQLSGIGGVERPGIVHRLDQYTSGLMVVAKSDTIHVSLSYQFAHRLVEKLYHALACGDVQPPAGEIDASIARHPSHRKCMAVVDGGRTALTSYRVLERLHFASLVEARLHTGRTHQVRVHLKHIGYPLVGDNVYGKKQNALLAEQTGFLAERHMLHARFLAFTHPATQNRMVFEIGWPDDFRRAMEALRLHSAGSVR